MSRGCPSVIGRASLYRRVPPTALVVLGVPHRDADGGASRLGGDVSDDGVVAPSTAGAPEPDTAAGRRRGSRRPCTSVAGRGCRSRCGWRSPSCASCAGCCRSWGSRCSSPWPWSRRSAACTHGTGSPRAPRPGWSSGGRGHRPDHLLPADPGHHHRRGCGRRPAADAAGRPPHRSRHSDRRRDDQTKRPPSSRHRYAGVAAQRHRAVRRPVSGVAGLLSRSSPSRRSRSTSPLMHHGSGAASSPAAACSTAAGVALDTAIGRPVATTRGSS